MKSLVNLNMGVGVSVATIRKDHGLTQRQLAELCGMNYSQLARIETGANSPSVDTLNKILSALGYGLAITKL